MNPTLRPTKPTRPTGTTPGLRALFESLPGEPRTPSPPDINDLVRLHRIVRRAPLRHGARVRHRLLHHRARPRAWRRTSASTAPLLRERLTPELPAVPGVQRRRQRALDRAHARIASRRAWRARVHLTHSPVSATTFGGRLCHTYDRLPDVVPDLIYLDGPTRPTSRARSAGSPSPIPERTVMAADILVMEPTLLPGTVIVVDGRESNIRFLTRNLQRPVVAHASRATSRSSSWSSPASARWTSSASTCSDGRASDEDLLVRPVRQRARSWSSPRPSVGQVEDLVLHSVYSRFGVRLPKATRQLTLVRDLPAPANELYERSTRYRRAKVALNRARLRHRRDHRRRLRPRPPAHLQHVHRLARASGCSARRAGRWCCRSTTCGPTSGAGRAASRPCCTATPTRCPTG